MNDLVKRLRAKCKLLHQCVEMRREAADEIERLHGLCDHWTALVEEHEAEIERLRAVVDAAKVVQLAMDGGEVDCPFCAYDGLQEALAALEDDDE